MVDASDADPAALDAVYQEMEQEGRDRLDADEVAREARVFQRLVDCRYVGQAYELLVPLPPGQLDADGVRRLTEAFESAHEREFFYRFEGAPVQIVHLRSYAIGVMPKLTMATVAEGGKEPPAEAVIERRTVLFAVDGSPQACETPFYERSALRAGNELVGPAIVEQLDSTTVLPPDCRAHIRGDGTIVIDVGQEAQ